MEDLKSPLMVTPYDVSYLTGGCWSPTRPGVFFTTKTNGTMDVWDYHYKQNEPMFSTKIGESGLTSIKVQSQGKLVALGSEDGTATILQISGALSDQQPSEKIAMQMLLEREKKRDFKESRGGPRPVAGEEVEDEATKELLRKTEEEFFSQIDIDKPDEGGAAKPE